MHSIKFNGKGRYARLLITSVFLLASVQSAFAQNADFYFQRSLKRVKAGDKKGAIADLSMAIKLDTKSQGAFYNRANLYTDLKQYKLAKADFDQALKLNPKDSGALVARGSVERALGDEKAAMLDYNRAIGLNPRSTVAYKNRGNLSFYLGEYKAALYDYEQTLRLDPNDEDAFINRGNARSALRDYKGAIEDYNVVLHLNKNDGMIYSNRGVAREGLRDYIGAIEDFEKALKLDPKLELAYFHRGNCYRMRGDYKLAIADYEKALEIDPDHVDAQKYKDFALRALNLKTVVNARIAPSSKEMVQKSNTKNSTAINTKVAIALTAKSTSASSNQETKSVPPEPGSAIAAVQKMSKTPPDKPPTKKTPATNAWIARGDHFFQEKRYGRAIESYKRALYEDQSLSAIVNRKIHACVAKLK